MEDPLIIKNDNDLSEKQIKIDKAVDSWGSQGKDPYYRSNFISKLFFYWAFRTIKLANITPLKPEYLGTVEAGNKSKEYSQRLYTIWNTKNYKNKKKNGLMKTILRANLWSMIGIIVLSLITVGMEILCTHLFREYIKHFDKTYESQYSIMQVGVAYFSLKILAIFFSRRNQMYQNFIGFKSGNELNAFIYDKVLRASPASMTEKSKEGEIINFMQVDSVKLTFTMTMSPAIFTIPIQIVVYIYLLFLYLGISFIAGFVTLIIFLIINFIIQGRQRTVQKEIMKKKDDRMKVTTETFNSLKVLKLYGWEDEFLNRIERSRQEEISTYKKFFCFTNTNLTLLWLAPVAVSVASIGAYQHFAEVLVVANIFTCIQIFNTIQEPIRSLPWTVNNIMECFVSMKRIEKFLKQEDIDTTRVTYDDLESIQKGNSVEIQNGNFSWGVEIVSNNNNDKNKKEKKDPIFEKKPESLKLIDFKNGKSKVSPNDNITVKINEENNKVNLPRVVLKNINISVKRGEFVCIIGEVGSGKSSLLQAMLNNMLPFEEKIDNPTKIIINGKVSYVSQMQWIKNDTVKNNILFHEPYDEDKYNRTLDLCELRTDLESLVGGDMTEIGEKGINLSGGQKARISIARAIYADSDIYMLDDPISALDAHVGQNIMKKCFMDYLSNKTRILVTHAIQYLPNADRIVYMNNGEIAWEGPYNELTNQEFFNEFTSKLKKRSDSIDKVVQTEEKAPIAEKKVTEVKRITKDEDKEEGNVNKKVYYKYILYMGGLCMFLFILLNMTCWQGLKLFSDLYLAEWTKKQNEDRNIDNLEYFWKYAVLGVGSCIFVFARVILISTGNLKLGKKLHGEMITNLVRAPINLFHDTIPKGQILNRLSKDMANLDIYGMFMYGSVIGFSFAFVGAIVICSIIEVYCLAFLPFLFVFGYLVTKYYINGSRDLSRLDGITRSPIINLLAETIPGAITIRAYKYEQYYKDSFYSRADEYFKIRLLATGGAQWFGLVLDLLSVTFAVFLILFTTFFADSYETQQIAILMTYSIILQDNLFRLLNSLSAFENCMVSMERCMKYLTIPQEIGYKLPIDEELSEWPKFGKIKFTDYSVKYRPDTEIVLKNLNFEVNPGEKVGVVGRTGSGKSTLCLCLFRILEPTSGSIIIDDVDITQVGLKKLRSSLTIIPQDPILMQGTMKYNIDPLNLYTDDEIKEVMQMIGFWYICEVNPKGLEQNISEGGSNLSVGEKQLVCITRAILRVIIFINF